MSKTAMKSKIAPASNSGLSLSNYKSSQNYLWNTNAVLGKGATGAVYFGHNKHTGETVAVKCFNHLSHMRPYEVQKREFEVLKKVNHENIVKLLAIEDENDTKQKVLVMELCTGGSLFNILDDPLNSNGLEEKEFLLVLKHLAAGMKHLRDMNIIHRDLKPGNIMKFVAEDGTSIYKLTDFGAARELDDDQQFMSLYGTEEYLHPDMYERAVLRKPVGKSFKANVDLWSIGVTLYHIATGSLPFRPYGGRKNKETMYKITTEKASGIISGSQTSENGEIKWSRNLPESCLLSPSVQPLVTELLAGLLECDAYRMWSFEKFFSSVTNILEHKVIYVYYVGSLSLHPIYCHSTEKVIDLKSRFDSLCKVPPNDQILVWANDELSYIIGNREWNHNSLLTELPTAVQNSKLGNLLSSTKRSINISTIITILPDDFPIKEINTTEHAPLFLLNGQMNSKIRCTSGPISPAKFPDMVNTNVNTEVDAQYAKLCASLAYATLRQIDRFIHNYKLACQIPCHMLKLIDKSMKLLEEKHDCFNFHLNILKERLDNLTQINNHLSQLIKLMVDSIVKPTSLNLFNCSNIEHIKSQYDKLNSNFKSLSTSSIMDEKLEQLKDMWPSLKELESIKHLVLVQSKAKIYTAKIRDSWLILHKDKQVKALNHHEEELHQLEKLKLDTHCKKLNDLVSKEINPCGSIADKLEEWYQGAQVAYVKPQLIISELFGFVPVVTELESILKTAYEDHNRMWINLFQEVKNFEAEWLQASRSLESPTNRNTVPNNNELQLVSSAATTSSTASNILRELKSLTEHSQMLKEAFQDFSIVFSEVQSINN